MNKKWFDRQFDFNLGKADFDIIIERLATTPATITNLVADADDKVLVEKKDGNWSVKEHVGHLILLESLWRTRLLDIKEDRMDFTPTDLANAATDEALFNNYPVTKLTAQFQEERTNTLDLLVDIDARSITTKSFHPRLKTKFGAIDHLYFVAEHDEHHLEYIRPLVGR